MKIKTIRYDFSVCKVAEKADFLLIVKKMCRDLNDCKEEMYHFDEITD